MRKTILALNKRTEQQAHFTVEQWENLERSGHTQHWKIIDDSALVSENAEMVVDFEFKTWQQRLEEKGIPYNKRIKDPEKLRAIYEEAVEKEEPKEITENNEEDAQRAADEIADDDN